MNKFFTVIYSLFFLLSFKAYSKEQSPLMKHIMFFAKHGLLSYDSMMNGHIKLGFKNLPFLETQILKLKIRAIIKLAQADDHHSKEELIEEVSKFASILENTLNPSSSGIWKVGGEINYTILDSICSKAENINGVQAITKSIVHEHLAVLCENKAECNEIATRVYLLPVKWSLVTSGSFDELFKYFGDIEGRDDAISVQKFRNFYIKNDKVLKDQMDQIALSEGRK